MIKLNSGQQKQRPRNGTARLLPLLLLVALAAGLVEERWRGQLALKNWKRDMAAKGEIFDATQLWPPITAKSVEFSNELAEVIKGFPRRLRVYGGSISAIVVGESGNARRGSQEPRPAINPKTTAVDQTYTWQDLNELLQQSQPALLRLRELMKDPPGGINYDAVRCLQGGALPNFVAHRIAAQTLHASAMNHLHNGNLEGAAQDLEALLSFGKVDEKDPTLINFMIRIAIIGMSIDVCWDALQVDGWTEPQLAALQSQCLDITNMLSQLPRTLETERISRIYELNWFRSHTYQEWIARYQELYAGFGVKPSPTDVATPVRVWRQWVFHPLWSLACADEEELNYLQDVQPEVAALRESPRKLSYLWLKEQTTASHQNYRLPIAAWRFYVKLPLVDNLSAIHSGPELRDSEYPYPDFSKAWLTAMKNLTLHELVITAIAIKRYELKYGQSPAGLAALVPEFLPALPRDLMDGQPLRYRHDSSGTFTFYSVGEDALDDNGTATPGSTNSRDPYRSHWNGKDWVWPQVAASVKGQQVAN